MKKLLKKEKLKDVGFVLSIYLFLTTLFFRSVAFANPCVPGEQCGGMIVPERSIFFLVAGIFMPVFFNIIVDSIVLMISAFLILKIRATRKKYLVSLLLLVIVGSIADYLGVLTAASIVPYEMYELTAFGLIAALIVSGDFFVCKRILKVTNKQAAVIALAMAILTNPIIWSKILG